MPKPWVHFQPCFTAVLTESPCWRAGWLTWLSGLQALLDLGCNVNVPSPALQLRPAHSAALCGSSEAVLLLDERGANLSLRGELLDTAGTRLQEACGVLGSCCWHACMRCLYRQRCLLAWSCLCAA